METIVIPDSKDLLNMRVFIPLVVAHQLYRIFKSSQAKSLVLLAADALNKTSPMASLKARADARSPEAPDSLFLLNNMDCLQPTAVDAWPKRLINKAKWGEFATVMNGLELYLSTGGALQQGSLTADHLKVLSAMLAFATFDIETELDPHLVQALFEEQRRVSQFVLEAN